MKRIYPALALTTALALTSCSPTDDTHAISVDNCGRTVNLSAPPEAVTLLTNSAVPTLDALGVLDHVDAKAGVFPSDYYTDDLAERIDQIPTLTDRVDASGHLQISHEAVLATNPDMVIGSTDTVNAATLSASDIPLIEEPAFCGSIDGDVTFDHVYDQVALYGEVFDKPDAAAAYTADLRARVNDLRTHGARQETRTAAVVYPTPGGGATYAYGRGSMSAPILDAAGLSNVFADQSDRIFEVTAEEIINRDPDVIIALHTDGDPAATVDALTSLPGADTLTAVRNDTVLPLLLNYAEPPTPLAVDGLEHITTFLEETR